MATIAFGIGTSAVGGVCALYAAYRYFWQRPVPVSPQSNLRDPVQSCRVNIEDEGALGQRHQVVSRAGYPSTNVLNSKLFPEDHISYSVSDLFMEKHVSLLHEMPSEKKRLFADKKAKIAYTNNSLPLPGIYSIIFVSSKNEFRRVIENEAKKHNDKISTSFTTTKEFHVMNFTLGKNDKYSYEKNQGSYRLVLKCDSDYQINHLESVVPTTLGLP